MNRSESIARLAAALSKAQGMMSGAVKGNENPYFKSKYADLASVWDACREPLSTNELAVVQTVEESDTSKVVVETVLMHSSGEWVSGRISMKPTKDDPQGIGSAITYARRYGLQAIAGIAPEDDDGNAASEKQAESEIQRRSFKKSEPAPPTPQVEYITTEQARDLHIDFRNALPTDTQHLSKDMLRDFCASKGYKKGEVGSASAIPVDKLKEFRKQAMEFAQTLTAVRT